MKHSDEIRVRVVDVTEVADNIKHFRFAPIDVERLPSFSGGAHITVMMEAENRRIRNSYSLVSAPTASDDYYEISVLRVEPSRGGSQYMHGRVSVGTELWIGQPINQFPPYDLARKHLLIAGGIGITPFMAMTAQLTRLSSKFELHYAVRSDATGAYLKCLQETYGDQVSVYRSSLGEHLPVAQLLKNQPLGTHLYVCGPERLIDETLKTARRAGWPEDSLHWERFVTPPPGDPFTVRLARSELDVHVGEDESILEAVEAANVDAPYLCRGGVCGQCETRVLKCDGTLKHNDEFLTEEERAGGEQLMICMSRFRGRELILDL